MTPSVKEVSHKRPYLYEMCRIGKSIKTKSRLEFVQGWGVSGDGKDKGKWLLWIWGFFLFWVIRIFPTWIVLVVAQLCEYHLKIIELYNLNQQKMWHVNYISIKHSLKYPLRGGSPQLPNTWVGLYDPTRTAASPCEGLLSWPSLPLSLSVILNFDQSLSPSLLSSHQLGLCSAICVLTWLWISGTP